MKLPPRLPWDARVEAGDAVWYGRKVSAVFHLMFRIAAQAPSVRENRLRIARQTAAEAREYYSLMIKDQTP